MGQKTRSNTIRLGINQSWKSDSASTYFNKSTSNNLFLYFSLKTELKKMKIFLFDYKFIQTSGTFKTCIFLSVYFRLKTNKKKFKWWHRFKKLKIKTINQKTDKLLLCSLTNRNVFYSLSKNYNNNFDTKKLKNNKRFVKPFNKSKFKKHIKLKKISNILENKLFNFTNKSLKIIIFNVLQTMPRDLKAIVKNAQSDNTKFKNNLLKEFLILSNLSLAFKKTDLLCEILADELQKSKKPNWILRSFKEILFRQKKYFNLKGLKLSIWGKFKKAGRTKKRILQIGKLSFSQFSNQVSQSLLHCDTRYGVFGIRLSFIY